MFKSDILEEDIKQRRIESKGSGVIGILVMDFKMEFNPLSARESTVPLTIMRKRVSAGTVFV